eukprot:m.297946 g.297946  ORF g.297946 m.297946 type:complete len:52 (+) comp40780_c0_seq6:200-355(+)
MLDSFAESVSGVRIFFRPKLAEISSVFRIFFKKCRITKWVAACESSEEVVW